MTIKSFDYISEPDAIALILGTMPGDESLAKKEYYAHPDNTFWDMLVRILASHLTEWEMETISYEGKKKLLLTNRIALWDVLEHCDRAGSRDIKIRNEARNDFKNFFVNHPKVKVIFFNGEKAHKYFLEGFKPIVDEKKIELIVLPSSSPSRQLNCFRKLKAWQIIKEKVGSEQ
jgi:hypoxanthine-DNA glycosylase